MATIEFRQVGKIFHTRRQNIEAVRNYSMTVEKGDFVSIVGPSGCGKSTLIRMLCGIVPPTSGQMLVDGEVLTPSKWRDQRFLRKMGFIFQQPNMLP